jgi:hypothetical protein
MITDIFLRRYRGPLFWSGSGMPREMGLLLTQLTHIVMVDLLGIVKDKEAYCQRIHDQLTRELGMFALAHGESYQQRCGTFLAQHYDLYNNSHGDANEFAKARLSLVELAFREAEAWVTGLEKADTIAGGLLRWSRGLPPKAGDHADEMAERVTLTRTIEELNGRFRQARIHLHYHAGVIQQSDDDLTTQKVEEPFWRLVHDKKWENVELDMKEALDRRDSGGRDAVLYALKALESVIKIISNDKGWTRGTERGAANYIDNLVSERNGRFVDVWESEMLKKLFSELRNLHGHGPGDEPMPALPIHQQTWAIDASMSWIKSLIHRL